MNRGFIAQFGGECAECEDSIEVGDLIIGAGHGYAHVDCVDLDDDENEESPDPEPDEKPTRFQGTSLDEMGF